MSHGSRVWGWPKMTHFWTIFGPLFEPFLAQKWTDLAYPPAVLGYQFWLKSGSKMTHFGVQNDPFLSHF